MTNERLPLAQPPYHPKVQEVMDGLRFGALAPVNLMKTLAHNSRLMVKIQALGGTLLFASQLAKREQEIIIIRIGARTHAEYEWGMHVTLYAGECGLGEDDIRALTQGAATDTRWSARESMLIRAVDELHDSSTISGALWQGMAREWDSAQIVELVVTIGYYHMMSFLLNAVGVPLEQGAERFSALQSGFQTLGRGDAAQAP